MLGYEGRIAGRLFFREVTEQDGGVHKVLTCEPPTWVGHWHPSELPIQELRKPQLLFRKLDPTLAQKEPARM